MPEVVTRRYNPLLGPWLNICSLPDLEAEQVLDRLRGQSRPTLKPDYLCRRRATESWLCEEAAKVLGQSPKHRPVYFFLGDFSWFADPSRPAALVLPLSSLPPYATTFTLGDSMRVADEPIRRVYPLEQMVEFFANPEVVAGFGLSDKLGVQNQFIEVQVWDSGSIAIPS